jgi:hypothetical protein
MIQRLIIQPIKLTHRYIIHTHGSVLFKNIIHTHQHQFPCQQFCTNSHGIHFDFVSKTFLMIWNLFLFFIIHFEWIQVYDAQAIIFATECQMIC